jgi:hypothetical protein
MAIRTEICISSYNRKIKSQIRKKVEKFEKFELPLLVEKGLIFIRRY